jgi:alpha-ribazole phosphatase
MSRIYLLRHGEPETRGVLLGQSNAGLSAAGRTFVAHLQLPRYESVYTSPLRRCLETCIHLNLTPTILPELAEITYGEWDGLTWEEIERRWPEIARSKLQDWFGVTPPGGELWSAFEGRVGRALERILSGPQPAIVVGHEAVHAVIAARLTGQPQISFRQRYGELIDIEMDASDPATA